MPDRTIPAMTGFGVPDYEVLLNCVLQEARDDEALLKETLGPMYEIVTRQLGSFAIMLPLSERKRRQVFYACLARNRTADCAASLARELITLDNDQLISRFYTTVPTGFISALGKLGEAPCRPGAYLQLHATLTRDPELSGIFSKFTHLRDTDIAIITRLHMFPEARQRKVHRITSAFINIGAFDHFTNVYRIITGEPVNRTIWVRLENGADPARILNDAYMRAPFPAPVLRNPAFRHLPNGKSLHKAGIKYKNCLATHIIQAMKGRYAFYVFTSPAPPGEEIVIALQHDGFSWYLSEAKLFANGCIPSGARSYLEEALTQEGVRTDQMDINDFIQAIDIEGIANDHQEFLD